MGKGKSKRTVAATVDAYIAGFPEDVQELLERVRRTIGKAAPGAQEKISYAIPTFTLSGNLVHFAAFERHVGFYPGASGVESFKKELSAYKNAKGSVQFPLDRPIPYGLIAKIVKFRVKENLSPRRKKLKRRSAMTER
jgi:uncharacterized protein YdhG (YjbR/CyaY superfamily)